MSADDHSHDRIHQRIDEVGKQANELGVKQATCRGEVNTTLAQLGGHVKSLARQAEVAVKGFAEVSAQHSETLVELKAMGSRIDGTLSIANEAKITANAVKDQVATGSGFLKGINWSVVMFIALITALATVGGLLSCRYVNGHQAAAETQEKPSEGGSP